MTTKQLRLLLKIVRAYVSVCNIYDRHLYKSDAARCIDFLEVALRQQRNDITFVSFGTTFNKGDE